MSKRYFVYILECKDQKYYVGVTNDIEERVNEHNQGSDTSCYTYHRRPVVLRYFEETNDVYVALEREKQLKGWSRKKKEALIMEMYETLPVLAASEDHLPAVILDLLGKDDVGESGRPSTGSG